MGQPPFVPQGYVGGGAGMNPQQFGQQHAPPQMHHNAGSMMGGQPPQPLLVQVFNLLVIRQKFLYPLFYNVQDKLSGPGSPELELRIIRGWGMGDRLRYGIRICWG